MSNQTKRTEAYQRRLMAFLLEEYGFKAEALSPAKRGFYGETWKIETAAGRYFAKLVYFPEHRPIYAQSFEAIDFLRRNGIDYINTVVKTKSGTLFTHFDGAVLGLFDWIDGENIETNETKPIEYRLLAKIYTIPHSGLRIRTEDFSGSSADMFFRQWSAAKDEAVLSLLEENRAMLEHRAGRLRHFAGLCQKDTAGFYITHGDAGGNFFVSGGKPFLIDWDDVLLAPPERDAWVMGYCGWARTLFQRTLRQYGIDYSLKPERLAYYCYYMFFFWLTWLTRCADAEEIANFFATYSGERIGYADALWENALYAPPHSQ